MKPKPLLLVVVNTPDDVLNPTHHDYLVRGISEDVTLFKGMHFQSLEEIVQYLGHKFQLMYRITIVKERNRRVPS